MICGNYKLMLYKCMCILALSYYHIQISNNFHQQLMSGNQPQPPTQLQPEVTALKLYVFGSCQSDQYYHPKRENESKRPICLSDIQEFVIEDEEEDEGDQKKMVIPNPLKTVSINKIACGALHTVVSTVEGKVFTFGCNDEGALGREGIEKVPIEVKLDHVIDLISAGDNHSVFASSGAGVVYFTGNYKFMRGQKMVQPIKTPIMYDINEINNRQNSESKLSKVVSGSNHSAILIAGKIFIRGEPEAHTVGRRINERHKLKSSLTFDGVGLNNVEDLWCGGYHTIAKIKKGNSFAYYGWGLNKHGQLGINSYDQNPYPVQITKLKGKNIVDVAAGTNFTVFLTEQGQLLGCGQNDEGQLGLGEDYEYLESQDEEEKRLSTQIHEKMNIKEDGSQQHLIKEEIKAQGNGNEQKKQPIANSQANNEPKEKQQASIPKEEEVSKPKLKEQNMYIKSIKPIPFEGKVTRLTAGSQFVYAWNDNELYSWGFGMNYVLLNGSEENEFTPFKVKQKIINEHKIYQLLAGAQHVTYLSYPSQARLVNKIELSESARRISIQSRKKLSRRRRSPVSK